MNTTVRITIFGAISGVLWSLLVNELLDRTSSSAWTLAVIIAGLVTGIVVSFAFRKSLLRSSRMRAMLVGAATLPVAGFCFGFLVETIHWLTQLLFGNNPAFTVRWFAPLETGLIFAVFSVLSLYTIILLPLAILTTFYLRFVLRRSTGNAS